MLTRVFNFRSINITLTLVIIVGALICIFTPNYFFLKLGTRFAGIVMLGYLILGMFFLLIKQSGLMMTSFICCAGLCLFLKNSANTTLLLPAQTKEEIVEIVHFNMSSSNEDLNTSVGTILETDADFISVQDVTPEWKYLLNETLGKKYPYYSSIERLDPYGLAIFSKYPFIELDTFMTGQIPNLEGKIEVNQTEFRFIAGHTTPPLFSTAYSAMQKQMSEFGERAAKIKEPLLMMGNFNAPPWWSEIQQLRQVAELEDSRISASIGITDIFQSPTDYILFSKDLTCVGFTNIFTPNNDQFGIQGTYQLSSNLADVK